MVSSKLQLGYYHSPMKQLKQIKTNTRRIDWWSYLPSLGLITMPLLGLS